MINTLMNQAAMCRQPQCGAPFQLRHLVPEPSIFEGARFLVRLPDFTGFSTDFSRLSDQTGPGFQWILPSTSVFHES